MDKARREDLVARGKKLVKSPQKSLPEKGLEEILHELETYQIELEAQNLELLEKQQESLRLQSEISYLFDNTPVGHIVIDNNFNILRANSAAQTMLEIKSSKGKTTPRLAPAFSRGHLASFLSWINSDLSEPLEVELKPGETSLWVRMDALLLDEEKPQRHLVSFLDITSQHDFQNRLEKRVQEEIQHRKEQEKMLLHQSKLASMGEMISAIAHQWRQPLNAVSLSVSIIEEKVSSPEYEKLAGELDPKFNTIFDQITYMSQTIDDFRSYFRSDEAIVEIDPQEVISSTLRFYEAQFSRHSINYSVLNNFEENTFLMIKGRRNQLIQVLLTLYQNARDAIVENDSSEREIQTEVYHRENSVHIAVEDSGGGVPEDIQQKIFEPYFTTKGPSVGTGIGLYIANTILRDIFAGTLTFENRNKGARFLISIPQEKKNG